MPDVLTGLLAEIPDESSLSTLAGNFNQRAEMLSRDGSSEAKAWAGVYSVLAVSAESALLRRKTGVSI